MSGARGFGSSMGGGMARRGRAVIKPKNLRGTLHRLFDITAGQRKGFGAVLFFSGLSACSSVLSPLMVGKVISRISLRDPIENALLLLALVYVFDWFVNFAQGYLIASAGQRVVLHLRIALFDALKHLPLRFFDRHQHGELMSRLTNDVDNISTTISDSVAELMVYSFTILGTLTFMMMLSPFLTLVAIIPVILVLILTKVVTTRTRPLYARQQQVLGRLDGHVEETVSGLSMVKAYGREKSVTEQFESLNSELCATATTAQIWSGMLMPLSNVINNFGFLAVCVTSGIMAIRGQIEIGVIASFLLYVRQFSRPFVDIANIYNTFQTAVAGAERIFQIMDEPAEPNDRPDALSVVNPQGNITFDNIRFGYNSDEPVIHGISLHIPTGTKVAVVGQTGSGKTTLINLLERFYELDSGQILLDDKPIQDYRLVELRKTFGTVLQDPSLFEGTIAENISYGNAGAHKADIVRAATAAGASGFISRLEHGYDTLLRSGGSELSQGERQLLTIARAMLADAPVIILDEATSSVDTVTEETIQQAMTTMTAGRTSIVIAHRLSTIRNADLIVVIDHGRLVEQGTHEQLLAKEGIYAQMYHNQTGV
ncbi:ABC transporter ATP-binding protein [Bifidobacterium aquikefiri]|uniref:ABC transporter ATP-binding protein n=1 Tax=Bifidobacterium aquikefiri TaxID=1653207 RepID=UPI0039E96AF5